MRIQFVIALLLACMLVSSRSDAQTTTFTYQGRLQDGAVAAQGSYDLQFQLFTDLSGGSPDGVLLTRSSVPVTNGTFSVQLDFGAGPITAAPRYLEIRVKRPGDPSYTPLSPRQLLGSAPYAIRALNTTAVDVSAAGTSIVNAINDASTSVTINENRLPPVVRIKPAVQQVSASANANGTDALLNLRGTYSAVPASVNELKFLHEGGFVLNGFARDVGNTTGCAASIPATGAGTRFMWHPCRGSVRFGRVPTGQTNWDDANMDDFTFAGGNQVVASGYGAFSFGDQVTVSSTVGVGFGSGVTVSGTAGFSAGASNLCSGFACVALGYTVGAHGQGSVALGYRSIAQGDYSVAIGQRAATCTGGTLTTNTCVGGTPRTGSFVWADESVNTHVQSQADNEFRIRANGGIRLRVSTSANGNTPGAGGNVGCDLTVAVPSWTCASSRDVKENFTSVDNEFVLSRLRRMPISTFTYIADTTGTRNLGPVAEDFYEAFSLGNSDKSINAQNMAGVSLAAVKGLDARTSQLQKENDALKGQLKQQQATIDALVRAVCAGHPSAGVCRP